MTETRSVSIDEVRTLVAERQRYDDWLSALESRRAETSARVFERVHGDYAGRRRDVMSKLREHVSGLSFMANDLDTRLASLESRLGSLEDERAEAMLRTAVGEFDADRWEQVRQDVESQIAELGEQRTGLLAEVEEVRTLLASAQSEPDPVPADETVVALPDVSAVDASIAEDAHSVAVENSVVIDEVVVDEPLVEPLVERLIDEPLIDVMGGSTIDHAGEQEAASSTIDMPKSSAEELVDLDQSLGMFSHSAPTDTFGPSRTPAVSAPSMDGLDVFDDAELGDLRMTPPARSTATVTPPSAPRMDQRQDAHTSQDSSPSSVDGFDDLAFLRSVVDPSAAGGAARGSASGEQQKTLRCTECGTMNLPTEWYCERCGGELAAF